jgi:hypothetical protein
MNESQEKASHTTEEEGVQLEATCRKKLKRTVKPLPPELAQFPKYVPEIPCFV